MATIAVKIDPQGAREGARVVKREMADITASANKMEGGIGRAGRTANDNFRDMARGSAVTSRGISSLATVAATSFATIAASAAAAFSVEPLFAFKDALAEVSTLVDTATFDMKALEKAALDQSAAFGGSAAAQTKAFYSIISAGASSAAEATEILAASNKLAVGGVTDVATASDGLTSVLNAYGDKVESATAVSDALFVAMRAGKTTIGELSGSLGKVAPLAAQTGVGFDELTAAISALTKGGIATAEATTGVRAILAAIAKPTKEASDLAKALGIQFNSAGLQAKGLAGFMQDLVKRTGGSTDALAQLFGGVEALVPAMALSGQAGVDFAAILEQMAQKAGATEDAFNKMANSPGFQAGRVWAALQAEVLGTAGAMSGPLTVALKAIADNMSTIVTVATIFTAGHLAAAILPVIANIVAMSSAMGAATVAARALSVAMAFIGGPVGLAVTALAGAYLLLRDNVSAAEQAATDAQSAFQSNETALNAAKGSSEGYTGALRNQIAMQVEAAKAALTEADAQLAVAKARALGFRESFGFGFTPLDYAADQARVQALELDGAYQKLEMQLAQVDANMKTVTTTTNNSGVSLSGLSDKAKKATKSYTDLVNSAVEFIANQQLEQQALGLTAEAANALRYEQDLLNKAANDNINLTPKQAAELRNLAEAMAASEAETSSLKKAMDFAKDTTKGFFSDLKSGLQNGESLWKSFANAATNALDKVIDKLLNEVIDSIFQVNKAASSSSGGGLGGFLSSLLGGFGGGSQLQIASAGGIGLYANGTSYAPGGIAMVGERGPELVELPRGARVNTASETRRMMSPANQSGSTGGHITVEVVSRVDDEGNIKPFVQRVSGEVAGQAVALAAPSIIERSQTASGQALGRGDYDSGMANYGVSRQARSR